MLLSAEGLKNRRAAHSELQDRTFGNRIMADEIGVMLPAVQLKRRHIRAVITGSMNPKFAASFKMYHCILEIRSTQGIFA
jgi:hypothetical protein